MPVFDPPEKEGGLGGPRVRFHCIDCGRNGAGSATPGPATPGPRVRPCRDRCGGREVFWSTSSPTPAIIRRAQKQAQATDPAPAEPREASSAPAE